MSVMVRVVTLTCWFANICDMTVVKVVANTNVMAVVYGIASAELSVGVTALVVTRRAALTRPSATPAPKMDSWATTVLVDDPLATSGQLVTTATKFSTIVVVIELCGCCTGWGNAATTVICARPHIQVVRSMSISS